MSVIFQTANQNVKTLGDLGVNFVISAKEGHYTVAAAAGERTEDCFLVEERLLRDEDISLATLCDNGVPIRKVSNDPTRAVNALCGVFDKAASEGKHPVLREHDPVSGMTTCRVIEHGNVMGEIKYQKGQDKPVSNTVASILACA